MNILRTLTPPAWVKVTLKHTGKALWEFRYVVLFGLMPIWAVWIILFVVGKDGNSYLLSFLKNGEALILCAATVGPLMYQLLDNDEARMHKAFPFRSFFVTSIIIICLIAAVVVGVKNVSTAEQFATAHMTLLSSIMSIFSVIIWLLIMGFNSALSQGAPAVMRQEEDDFVKSYGEPG